MQTEAVIEKHAWKGYIADGKIEEYKKGHDEIRDEMKAMLRQARIKNSIPVHSLF